MRAQFAADRAGRMAEARRLAGMLQALNTLGKPLIGRVAGAAYGGGVGLMAVCDSVVATADARFGLTEVRLGLIPATISPYVLARIGEGRARGVFFSGRVFDAAEAVALGLVTRAVVAEALDEAVEAEIAPYLAAAPAAVAAGKRLARSLGPRIDTEVIEATIGRLADTWETPEAQEGIAAFLEKRAAAWVR
jgi:methylglutaconyl-CoA hydratase